MQNFDIYFSGQLLPDASPEQTRAAIGKMFRLEGAALDQLFSGKPRRIKSGIDVDKAGRYREAFREAGALIDIVPEGAPAPQPKAPAQAQAPQSTTVADDEDEGLELLPPKTGSLADCAASVEPLAIPDTSWMKLDQPGVMLDETPETPPQDFDIQDLSMSGANMFSLEDCVDTREAKPIPDISHLSLANNDEV